MEDSFAFVQAVFHVVLFIVVHWSRARNHTRIGRRENQFLKRKEVP